MSPKFSIASGPIDFPKPSSSAVAAVRSNSERIEYWNGAGATFATGRRAWREIALAAAYLYVGIFDADYSNSGEKYASAHH